MSSEREKRRRRSSITVSLFPLASRRVGLKRLRGKKKYACFCTLDAFLEIFLFFFLVKSCEIREYNRSRESLELVRSKLGKFLFSRKLELESCPRVTFIYNDPIR